MLFAVVIVVVIGIIIVLPSSQSAHCSKSLVHSIAALLLPTFFCEGLSVNSAWAKNKDKDKQKTHIDIDIDNFFSREIFRQLDKVSPDQTRAPVPNLPM